MLKLDRAVITGATGVLGTALIDKLIENNVEVYVVCHVGSSRNSSIKSHKCIHKIECNLEDFNSLPKLIPLPCDAFFHIGWVGTATPNSRMNTYLQAQNIKYSLDAVDVAKQLKCQVFIGAGSQAEYGRINGVIHPDSAVHPISAYGIAKLCAGQITRLACQQQKIRHIWTRVVSVYGSHDANRTLVNTVIDSLLAGKKPSLTAGEQIWDYLYAKDAADAFYKMATNGKNGAVYVLGSGRTRKLREFMEIIRDEINPSLPLGIGEIPYYPDQAMHLEADITSLQEDTGWTPKTDFRTGVSELIRERTQCCSEI